MSSQTTSSEGQRARVSKQVYELTLNDLKTSPVWEFRLDAESDEDQDYKGVKVLLSARKVASAR